MRRTHISFTNALRLTVVRGGYSPPTHQRLRLRVDEAILAWGGPIPNSARRLGGYARMWSSGLQHGSARHGPPGSRTPREMVELPLSSRSRRRCRPRLREVAIRTTCRVACREEVNRLA